MLFRLLGLCALCIATSNRAPFRIFEGTGKSGTKWHIHGRVSWDRRSSPHPQSEEDIPAQGLRYTLHSDKIVTTELPRVPLWSPNPTKQRGAATHASASSE